MEPNFTIYFLEIFVTIIILLFGFIIYQAKHGKGFFKFVCIVAEVYIIVTVSTFVLGNPGVHFDNVLTSKDTGIKPQATGKKISKAVIVDTIAPIITLNGESNIKTIIGSIYEEKGAYAIDAIDGDLTDRIVINGTVDTSVEGLYTITYTVTDNSGNSASQIRTISVEANPEKIIFLTFDDGPSEYTEKLLDTLKAYNVKATFFVTGLGDDDMIKREFDEGHTVGLHTNSHDYSYVYSSVDNYFEDLSQIQARVERITGQESHIIRFPGGSSNTVSRKYDKKSKIMSYLTNEVINRGFRYFDWNVDSDDAGRARTSDTVYNNVITTLQPNVSVVLQHDSKEFSVDAVPAIIEYCLENGYTFERITEGTPMVHHGVNN